MLTFNIPRSLARPSLSSICSIFDSQQSCGFFDVVFSILMANFSLRLLKAVKISPKAPEPSFWPTILYYPYVFIGNQNTESSILNINNKIPPLYCKSHSLKVAYCPMRCPNNIIQYVVIISLMSRYKVVGQGGRQEQSMMHGLIKELLKVWLSKGVQDRYQNYFLVYLDALSQKDAELAIAKEIKLTFENKSHFFRINRAFTVHKSIIGKLQKQIEEVKDVKDSNMIDMSKIASLLQQLRNNNLEVAESVLQFNYECLGSRKHPLELITGNNYLFEQLNADNDVLKGTFLEEFITFTDSYDPFLLFHYEHAKKVQAEKAENHQIQQIFTLSVSKAYKFMKAQQQILEFLSGKIPNKLIYGKIKRFNYNFIDEKNRNEEMEQDYNGNVFKLQNDAYIKKSMMNEQEQTERDYYQRAKTQESPLKGIIFNTKHPKKIYSLFQNQNRHQLPKLESVRRTEISPLDSPLYHYRPPNTRKFSEQESPKYTFKIRRRMSIRGNESPSSFGERQRGYVGNINKILRRQEQFLNFSAHPRRESIDRRQDSFLLKTDKCNTQQIDQNFDDEEAPLSNKFTQQLRTLKVQPIIMQKQEKTSLTPSVPVVHGGTFKNFKLKAGNLKVGNIFIFLKELNVQPYYRSMFEVQNWEHLLRNNQYYMHKFYVDDVLQAISLCCGLPDANILIKYWAPLQTCDRQMSNFLFRKYLEHMEKNSICKAIYYSLSQIPELINNGFTKYNEKILAKQRSIPQQIDSFNYFPFLTVNFSIVGVSKDIAKEQLQNITIKSNTVAPFNQRQFVCFNYLLITNKIINLASGFSGIGTYTPNIKNFREVGTKLIKQQLYETAYNMQLNIPNANLMTLRLRHPVHSPFFVANHPLIKFIGDQVYSDSESLVVSLQMIKNTRLYFGKGFKSINSMMTVIKNRPSTKNKIEYCIRMFSKRMRGRLLSLNLRDEYTFGDFQVVFQWIDFLKGKIEQDLKGYELFGEENFYCIIQIQNQYILGFEIKPENLL